jgi:4-amino-4-deoxy-L-arabinose transferase-like glycosyltransferase
MDGSPREATDTLTRRDVATILAVGLLLFVPSFLTRDVWTPDEPRYVEVAREMVQRCDYLVPHLNGEIYPDKPPLFFWLAAGLWHLGLGPNSGRIVAALSAMGVLLLTYALGRRLYGREAGLWAALVTLTTLLFMSISRIGNLDPLLSFCIVAGISFGVHALEGGGSHGKAWLGFYAAAALGVLTKGPVGLVVPGLVLLAYGLARRKEATGGGWWHLGGALLFIAVVAAWLVPAVLFGGREYSTNIVFQQTLQRVKPSGVHGEPFHYFLVRAPLYLWPWSPLLVLALVAAVKAARREGEKKSWLPILWLAVVLVFFSIPSGKRERYVLPMVPAAGLLCARYIQLVAAGAAPWRRWHTWLWRATFGLVAIVPVALIAMALCPAPAVERFLDDRPTAQDLLAAIATPHVAIAVGAGTLMLVMALLALCLPSAPRGERRRAGILVASLVVLSLALDLVAMPLLNRSKSARSLVEDARAYLDTAERVYLFDADFGGAFGLFLQRREGTLKLDLTHEQERELNRLDGKQRRERERALLEEKLTAALASPQPVAVVSWRDTVLESVDLQRTPGLAATEEDPREPGASRGDKRTTHPEKGPLWDALVAALSLPRRVVPVTWKEPMDKQIGPGRSHVVRPARRGHPTLVLVLNWNPEAGHGKTPSAKARSREER